MSRIERKYCLISTSYLAGLFHISWQNCVCFGDFLPMRTLCLNLNLISVQSWTYLANDVHLLTIRGQDHKINDLGFLYFLRQKNRIQNVVTPSYTKQIVSCWTWRWNTRANGRKSYITVTVFHEDTYEKWQSPCFVQKDPTYLQK